MRVAIVTVQIFVQHAWSVRNASNILDAEVPTTKKACSATAGSECHSDRMYVLYTATFTADAQQQTVRIPSKQHAYKPYQNHDAIILRQHNHGYLDLLSRPAWWTIVSSPDEGELSTLSSCSGRVTVSP